MNSNNGRKTIEGSQNHVPAPELFGLFLNVALLYDEVDVLVGCVTSLLLFQRNKNQF